MDSKSEFAQGGEDNNENNENNADNDDPGTIDLTITDAQGEQMFFKVKRTTKMRRLFHAYCKRISLDPSTIRFFYKGESIDEDQTPDDLVLKDGANIDAFVRQVAGSF